MEISGDKAYNYTQDEILKQINLLEIHLKQSKIDPDFCNDCVSKHLFSIRGLIDEQEGFAHNENERENLENMGAYFTNLQKKKDFKENGPEYANEVRKYRKMLIYGNKSCPSCERKSQHLNNRSDYDDSDTYNRGEDMKQKIAEIGVINGASLAGAAGVYLGQYLDKNQQAKTPSVPLTWTGKYSTYVGVGGGIGLQLVGLFAVKNDMLKTALVVAGSYLLATSISSIIQEVSAKSTGTSMRRMAGPVRMSVGNVMPQPYGIVQID